jgi:hypothetical protein
MSIHARRGISAIGIEGDLVLMRGLHHLSHAEITPISNTLILSVVNMGLAWSPHLLENHVDARVLNFGIRR